MTAGELWALLADVPADAEVWIADLERRQHCKGGFVYRANHAKDCKVILIARGSNT